jgi:aminoglycoside phosphotransferase (APT) family kinase protein
MYSTRLGPIAPAQFQAALDRFGLGRFVEAEPIVSGLFGQNVFVTSDCGRYVLHGCPHYDWQFPKERFVVRLLHEWTKVPVPWSYLVDERADVFAWSYALMPRMPGLGLPDRPIGDGLGLRDRRGVARALADNLTQIHALTWPFASDCDLRTDTIAPFNGGYTSWIVGGIRNDLAASQAHSRHTTAEDVEWVEGIIATVRDSAWESGQARLVMRDYKAGNLTFRRAAEPAGGWQVSGVFDLMEAHFGDAEADLPRPIALYLEAGRLYLAREFPARYRGTRPAPSDAAAQFKLYMLRDRLIIWEYLRRPENKWREYRTLRQWASRYTDVYRDIGGEI